MCHPKRREAAPAGRPSLNHPTPKRDAAENNFRDPALQALRLKRDAGRVHRLGARVLYELLDEMLQTGGPAILDIIERYANLDPEAVRAVGGDRFPTSPTRRVA